MAFRFGVFWGMEKILEIKAAEGGKDSQLLVSDLADAYARLFQRLG